MVSIVIGKKGYKIKQLESKTNTKIYIESCKTGSNIWNTAQITGKFRFKRRGNKRHSGSY